MRRSPEELPIAFCQMAFRSVNPRLVFQIVLEDFVNATAEAARQGLRPDVLSKIGGWELVFRKPRIPGGLPVIYHSLFR